MSEGKAEQASEVKTDKKLDGGAEQVSEGACDGYQNDFLIFEYWRCFASFVLYI